MPYDSETLLITHAGTAVSQDELKVMKKSAVSNDTMEYLEFPDSTKTGQDEAVQQTLQPEKGDAGRPPCSCVHTIVQVLIILVKGWRTYIRQPVIFAGLSLAMLYMTVMGFDSITVGE